MKRRKLYCASNYSSPTSFPYKGRRIKLLSDGSGWAIFDTDGELYDSGFKTKEEACRAIDEYDKIYQSVQAATDESPEEVDGAKLTFDEIYSKYTSSPQTTSTVWNAEDFFKFMKEMEDNA